jgi:hypothetical protein
MTRSRILTLAAAVLCIAALWAMYAPIPAGPREQLFEIPAGTYERRAAGEQAEILPAEIRLTLGVKDILVLKNLDKVPQTFGPVLIMPGQSFSMPFGVAGDVQFECTAHASGRMRIVVDPAPDAGWPRLVWRARTALQRLKTTT